MRNAYKVFVGKREGKIQIGKALTRWKIYIKIDPEEISRVCVCVCVQNLNGLGQSRSRLL
jgi:hypothetical protein